MERFGPGENFPVKVVHLQRWSSEIKVQSTVKLRFTDTHLIRTTHYYGQSALSLGKGSPFVTDTPLLRTLKLAPSVPVLTRFDCNLHCSTFVFNRDGEEWNRVRQKIAPKMMRLKIVEENIANFNAVSKDAVARLAKLNDASEQNDYMAYMPDLEKEVNRWSLEGELIIAMLVQWTTFE